MSTNGSLILQNNQSLVSQKTIKIRSKQRFCFANRIFRVYQHGLNLQEIRFKVIDQHIRSLKNEDLKLRLVVSKISKL